MTVAPRLPHAHTLRRTWAILRRSGSTRPRRNVSTRRRNAAILRRRNSALTLRLSTRRRREVTPRRAPRIRRLHTLRRPLAAARPGRPEGDTLQVAVAETEAALDRTAVKSQLHVF
jgi:hypothetical protein